LSFFIRQGESPFFLKEQEREEMSILKNAIEVVDRQSFIDANWTGSFEDYLEIVKKNPLVAASSFRRMYEMIIAKGTETKKIFKREVTHYKFFDDETNPIFGLNESLMVFVDVIKAAAFRYGPERRVILLHGPVGSAKSTLCSLLKKGLEEYSKTDEGAVYSYSWKNVDSEGDVCCPINEEPLKLFPKESRKVLTKELGSDIFIEGALCPKCQFYYNELMNKYDGDFSKVLDHIEIRRVIFSESSRVGIGTFQPKDEKSIDATELTGDINFRMLGKLGVDSDPRAFSFKGEFQIANRGMLEFIEMLKLPKEFLYDLLGATQEHQVKPKKFAQMAIDEVLISHTNDPEYQKVKADETMEALRDRTIRVDLPYLLRLDDELAIYNHVYNSDTVKQHIAPHTLEIAAMWAVLTRLEEPKKNDLDLMDKAKLYNGKTIPGWTEDGVRELKESHPGEGMKGISARYVANQISNALAHEHVCINPFMVLHNIEQGLEHYSLIASENDKGKYKALVSKITKEYDDILKNEIQRALIGDEDAIKHLCENYIGQVVAYVNDEKVQNPITGKDEEPNDRLMRSIEEKIEVSESMSDDFRRQIVSHIGSLASKGDTFDYKSNARLMKALELKLFEDTKDSIKLSALSELESTVDPNQKKKLDELKQRMIDKFGYCEKCAKDALQYCSSVFARGDIVDDDEE
jgi:serine protein kinase